MNPHKILITGRQDSLQVVNRVTNLQILAGAAAHSTTTVCSRLLVDTLLQPAPHAIRAEFTKALRRTASIAIEQIMSKHELRIIVLPVFQQIVKHAIKLPIRVGVEQTLITIATSLLWEGTQLQIAHRVIAIMSTKELLKIVSDVTGQTSSEHKIRTIAVQDFLRIAKHATKRQIQTGAEQTSITITFSLLREDTALHLAHRAIEEMFIEARHVTAMDVIATITIQHAARTIALRAFLQIAIPATGSRTHHGIRVGSITGSQ